jgi:hypothetical protein
MKGRIRICFKRYTKHCCSVSVQVFNASILLRAGNKGYSWTFLTPEQDWYSGDIIRALELSDSLVPQVSVSVAKSGRFLYYQKRRSIHPELEATFVTFFDVY